MSNFTGIEYQSADYAERTTDIVAATDWLYQEFVLPGGYRRGDDDDVLWPEIGGIQVKVSVAEGYEDTASISWSFETKADTDDAWEILQKGVTIGAQASGEEVWFDIYFKEPVTLTEEQLSQRFRFGIRAQSSLEVNAYALPWNKDLKLIRDITGKQIKANLFPGFPYHVTINDVPKIVVWSDPQDDYVYVSNQHGISGVWFTPHDSPGYERVLDPNGKPILRNGVGDDPINGIENPTMASTYGYEANAGSGSITTALAMKTDNNSAIGTQSLEVTGTPNNALSIYTTPLIQPDVVPDQICFFRGSGNLMSASAGANLVLVARWFNDTGVFLSESVLQTINTPATNTWQNLSGVATAPASAATAGIGIRITPSTAAGTKLRVDATMIIVDRNPDPAYATPDFFHGDTPGAAWLGTRYFSASRKYTPGVSFLFRLLTMRADEEVDELGNKVRHVVKRHKADHIGRVDSESTDKYWMSKPNPSKFAVENLYFDMRDVDGNPTTVDRLMIDPITPGVYFSVYHTNEDDPRIDEDIIEKSSASWDERLWKRVPQTFKMTKRDTHAFREPITAKYIAVEFTHLQARPHQSLADNPIQITYQKHPKWVLDYFMAYLAVNQSRSIAARVGIEYSSLDLGYNYYLDDLRQSPDDVVFTKSQDSVKLNEFLSDQTDYSDYVEPDTLAQIKRMFKPYRNHPAVANGIPSSIIHRYALEDTFGTGTDYPVERINQEQIANPNQVSSANRESVLLEKSYPVMFFYIDSRHRYRTVRAPLANDKAYFVGVREVMFQRDIYSATQDNELYIEGNGDNVNTERNDFVSSEGTWVVS